MASSALVERSLGTVGRVGSVEGLLPGEQVVLTKRANAVVALNEVGLQRLPFDAGMRLVGFDGREAIGGRLHVTNLRLLFESHAINRATGRSSVFLPTIRACRDASKGLAKRLEVDTGRQSLTFVVWGVADLIDTIGRQAAALGPADRVRLLEVVRQHPETVGEAFVVSEAMDRFVRNLPWTAAGLGIMATNPLGASALVGLVELHEAAGG